MEDQSSEMIGRGQGHELRRAYILAQTFEGAKIDPDMLDAVFMWSS